MWVRKSIPFQNVNAASVPSGSEFTCRIQKKNDAHKPFVNSAIAEQHLYDVVEFQKSSTRKIRDVTQFAWNPFHCSLKNLLVGLVFRKFEAVGFGCARGQGSRQNNPGTESNVQKVSSVWINLIKNLLQTVCGQAAIKSTRFCMGTIRDTFKMRTTLLGFSRQIISEPI